MTAIAEAPPVETENDPEDTTQLFDRSKYEQPGLRIDKIDGQPVDRPRLKFAGGLTLDRMSTDDVALFNRLPIGAEVSLSVTARVTAVGVRWTLDKDGELAATVGERTLNVDSAWLA